MRRMYKYILVIMLLGLAVAYAAWRYTFRDSESSVAGRRTDITIDAPGLINAYEANEDSANDLYLEKIILVSGTVGSVSQDSLGYSVYLKENDAGSGVLCSFDRASFEPSRIKPGSKVVIKGMCSGYLLDVILNRCSLAE